MTHAIQDGQPPFRPLRLIGLVLLMLLAISAAAQWYARNVTLMRYCADPPQTLTDLRHYLTQQEPAGNGARRPYIIAARLTFLVPRDADEPLDDYLQRVHGFIDHQCRRLID